MKTHEEMDKDFHRILEESDKKHTDAVRQREEKKRQLFSMMGRRKPIEEKK